MLPRNLARCIAATAAAVAIGGGSYTIVSATSSSASTSATSWPVADGPVAVAGSVIVANGPAGTEFRVQTAGADGIRNGQLMVRIIRVLRPGDGAAAVGEAGQSCLSATWRLADGSQVRGIFATARYLPEHAAQS